jgi:shikimate kinase
MNVVLIGYRGTGKSTIGRLVAKRLQMPFVDADEELERRAGRTIRDIFASDGEIGFRELESQVVADLLSRDQTVVALGGGAVLRPENRQVIRAAQNRVVWLQALAETLFDRIYGDPTTHARRPNLTAGGGMEEVVRLLAMREPLYRECAECSIDTEEKAPHLVAAEIVSWLGR